MQQWIAYCPVESGVVSRPQASKKKHAVPALFEIESAVSIKEGEVCPGNRSGIEINCGFTVTPGVWE